jgi:hypothetical protein
MWKPYLFISALEHFPNADPQHHRWSAGKNLADKFLLLGTPLGAGLH